MTRLLSSLCLAIVLLQVLVSVGTAAEVATEVIEEDVTTTSSSGSAAEIPEEEVASPESCPRRKLQLQMNLLPSPISTLSYGSLSLFLWGCQKRWMQGQLLLLQRQ
jgi:hypothetical protein